MPRIMPTPEKFREGLDEWKLADVIQYEEMLQGALLDNLSDAQKEQISEFIVICQDIVIARQGEKSMPQTEEQVRASLMAWDKIDVVEYLEDLTEDRKSWPVKPGQTPEQVAHHEMLIRVTREVLETK